MTFNHEFLILAWIELANFFLPALWACASFCAYLCVNLVSNLLPSLAVTAVLQSKSSPIELAPHGCLGKPLVVIQAYHLP